MEGQQERPLSKKKKKLKLLGVCGDEKSEEEKICFQTTKVCNLFQLLSNSKSKTIL